MFTVQFFAILFAAWFALIDEFQLFSYVRSNGMTWKIFWQLSMYRWMQTTQQKKIAKSTRLAFNKWIALNLLLPKFRPKSKFIFHPPFIFSRFNCLEICPNNSLIKEKNSNRIRASTQRIYFGERALVIRRAPKIHCVWARVYFWTIYTRSYTQRHINLMRHPENWMMNDVSDCHHKMKTSRVKETRCQTRGMQES